MSKKKKKIKRKRGYYYIEDPITGETLVRPAVTHVTGETLAKKALRYWHGSVGNEEAARISRKAMDFGSEMHRSLASYLRDEEIPFFKIDNKFGKEQADAWRIWDHWWEDNKVKPELVEETIWNDDYAGTLDFFGEGCLIDWKFSSGIYDSNKIQAGAYANIIGAERAKIVRIKEGTIEVCELDSDELKQCAEVFYSLLRVFNWREGR